MAGARAVCTLCKYRRCAIFGIDGKIGANIARHGIAFEDAQRIFEGPTVEKVDDRFEYDEVRVYAIGLVNGLEITVIYTDTDNDERRIISAWRADPHERRYFWQNLEE